MSAAAKKTSNPNNPCVRNCCLDEGKICLGCGRSLPEILEWHHADPYRQQQISKQAGLRRTERPTMLPIR